MTRIATAFLIATLAILPAAAQSAPPAAAPATPAAPAAAPVAPAAPASPAPAVTAAPTLTKDGLPRMKDVRQQCRDEVQGESLKGAARRDAMAACIVKARPDKAAQVKCQMDPGAKGLDKTARRSFVKDCVAKAKG